MKNVVRGLYGLSAVLLVLAAGAIIMACGAYGGNPAPATAPAAGGSPTSVTLSNFSFSPATLTVKAGATVTWANKDSVTHTVTSDGGGFDSGNLEPNATYSYTFNKAGTFTYFCAIHPSMKGTIVVQ